MTFLSLNPRFVYGSLDLTSAPFAVNQEGIDYQSGDLVVSVLSSFLQDGELEVSQRRGNMTLTVPVLIEATDLLASAQAHARLALEADRGVSTLTIDPGDGVAPPTVFETFEGDVAYTYNANAEQNGFRQYNLTVRALPHGRSDFKVTAQAVGTPPVTPSSTVVNDGSSTTGWSSANGPVSVVGGAVTTSASTGTTLSLTLAQSFALSGSPYLAWDYSMSVMPLAPSLTVNGAPADLLGVAILPSGYARATFMAPAGVTTVTTQTLSVPYDRLNKVSVSLSVDQVQRTNVQPGAGNGRQQLRTVAVAGSARTQGGVEIYSPTSSLGDVLVYSSVSALPPALGPFRDGAPTLDAARVSGGYLSLATARNYDVPASAVTPGLYALIALVSAPGGDSRTVSWSTVTRFGSLPVGRTRSGSAVVSGSDYQFVALGNVNLPTDGLRSATTAKQRVTLIDGGSGTAARLDELYLCNLTDGRLTIVSCGTGTPATGGPSSRLWLDPATIVSRTATVLRGTAADGSDAFYVGDGIRYPGEHEFVPPSATIFTATTNASDAVVTLSHFPRWLTHAALVAA